MSKSVQSAAKCCTVLHSAARVAKLCSLVRHQGSSKSFFDLRQRTLSGMDLMPAFRVVVLGLARKLKNNTKDNQLDNHCNAFVEAFSVAKHRPKLDKDMK